MNLRLLPQEMRLSTTVNAQSLLVAATGRVGEVGRGQDGEVPGLTGRQGPDRGFHVGGGIASPSPITNWYPWGSLWAHPTCDRDLSNPVDGLPLSAQLFRPPGEGPFSGVVLLTLAGAGELIERLTDLGWAVLMSERRGIATIEHLLRASFDDLAIDVRTGADYLRHRPGPGAGSGHPDLHGGRSPRAEPRLPHRAPLPASYGSCQPPIWLPFTLVTLDQETGVGAASVGWVSKTFHHLTRST